MSIIYTDNLCDLTKDELKRFKVEQISFPLTFFGETYRDFSTEEFKVKFKEALNQKTEIGIEVLTKEDYINAFKPALEAGQDILFIHASAKLFSTTANINNALESLKTHYPNNQITTIDSFSVSIGEGMLVKEVATKNIFGSTHEELRDFAKEIRKDIKVHFLVEDIKNLKNLTKIENINDLVGTTLGIKPILTFDEYGKVFVDSKVSGRKKGVLFLTELLKNKGKNLLDYKIEIVQSNCTLDADILKNNIVEILGGESNVLIRESNPIIKYFAGNTLLGIAFKG